MAKAKFKFLYRGNYINGQFMQAQDPNGEWLARAPGDLTDELGRIQFSYRSAEEAVNCARKAFLTWRNKLEHERAELLKQYQRVLKKREEELVEYVAREAGKPLWEAAREVQNTIDRIDVTIEASKRYNHDFVTPTLSATLNDGTIGVSRHRPIGVVTVVTSFSSPLYLPHGEILPALLAGDTVVFKPSLKSSISGSLVAECFHEAGFPAGVFNCILGDREVGRRLCAHEDVNAVLFHGSYEVGTRIKQDTLQQSWKLLALHMGGKNTSVIWEDADLASAVQQLLFGVFMSAGQSNVSTSRILVHKSVLGQFIDHFHQAAKGFSIGDPLDSPFMGPLIDQSSVDRYLKFAGIASREGAEIIMRGKSLEIDGLQGSYVTPSICLFQHMSPKQAKASVYQQTEILGPDSAIIPVEEIDETIALANATPYGLASSIFTKDPKIFERMRNEFEFGLINWNVATTAVTSRLPFLGLKKSGNHRQGEAATSFYCSSPVVSIECAEPKSPER